jgi:hypothetical protein
MAGLKFIKCLEFESRKLGFEYQSVNQPTNPALVISSNNDETRDRQATNQSINQPTNC